MKIMKIRTTIVALGLVAVSTAGTLVTASTADATQVSDSGLHRGCYNTQKMFTVFNTLFNHVHVGVIVKLLDCPAGNSRSRQTTGSTVWFSADCRPAVHAQSVDVHLVLPVGGPIENRTLDKYITANCTNGSTVRFEERTWAPTGKFYNSHRNATVYEHVNTVHYPERNHSETISLF